MIRHATLGAVIVAIAIAITLVFSTRTGKPAPNPQLATRDTVMMFKRCDQSLLALNTAIAQALTDDVHRNERLSAVMSPVEKECTQAEASIRDAIAAHPDDKRLAKMRERNAMGQQWLRDLSTAIAAYEVAAKTGSAAPELAKLQNLLQ